MSKQPDIEALAGEPGVVGCSNRALLAINPEIVAWAAEEMKRGTDPLDLIGGFVAVLLNVTLTAANIRQKTLVTSPTKAAAAQFILDRLGDELREALKL